jgi:hypothetical protein
MDAAELERRSRGISRDMSPSAVARRIRIVGDLHEVWQFLRTARRLGPVEPRVGGDRDTVGTPTTEPSS